MNDQTCPNCQSKIPEDAPGGVCPKCVFAAATSKQPAVSPYVTTAGGGEVTRRGQFIAPSPAELSECFSDLDVEEMIGHGGMGAVYRARQIRLDRIVALKILSPALGNDPTFAERFAREARTLARLTHPNIVMVFEFGSIDDMCFLVMEFVDGVNLRDAIRGKSITAEEALQVVPQICEALQFAHDEGVVHRDIKPENILLNNRGQIKIADFGLAKLLDRDPVEFTLTGTHQIVGTRNYMAPEQIEKPATVDHRADIYSLGVVFYELLTGELPIGRFANPSEKADINANLDEVVMRTLEKEPDRRYQQASEIKTAVEAVKPAPEKVEPAKPPVRNTQQAANDAAGFRAGGTAGPNMQAGFADVRSPIPEKVPARTHTPFSIADLNGGFAAAYGIAKFDSQTLNLEFDIRDEVFGAVKSKTKNVTIDIEDILSVTYKQGMFSNSIRFCTESVSVAAPVPQSKQGVFTLKISKKDHGQADNLVDLLQAEITKHESMPRQKPIPGERQRASEKAAMGFAGSSSNSNQDQADEQSPEGKKLKELQDKVNAPATALAIIAVINLCINGGRAIQFITGIIRKPQVTLTEMTKGFEWNHSDNVVSNFANFFADFVRMCVNPFDGREWILTIIASILMLIAANNMKRFRNYKLCVGIGIAALFPLYDIYFLGMAFAIWALAVLSDSEVRAKFEAEKIPVGMATKPSHIPDRSTNKLLVGLLLMVCVGFAVMIAALVFRIATHNASDSDTGPLKSSGTKQTVSPIQESAETDDKDGTQGGSEANSNGQTAKDRESGDESNGKEQTPPASENPEKNKS